MPVIYKYPFAIADDVTIRMPLGARILRVETQGGQPCLWALVDNARGLVDWNFRIYGTGHDVDRSHEHVATFQVPPFVWHMFLERK